MLFHNDGNGFNIVVSLPSKASSERPASSTLASSEPTPTPLLVFIDQACTCVAPEFQSRLDRFSDVIEAAVQESIAFLQNASSASAPSQSWLAAFAAFCLNQTAFTPTIHTLRFCALGELSNVVLCDAVLCCAVWLHECLLGCC